MQRADSFEKTLMLGGVGGRRRRGRQRMRWLDGNNDSMDMGLGGLRELWWTGRPGVLWFMGLQGVDHDWATELNWTNDEPQMPHSTQIPGYCVSPRGHKFHRVFFSYYYLQYLSVCWVILLALQPEYTSECSHTSSPIQSWKLSVLPVYAFSHIVRCTICCFKNLKKPMRCFLFCDERWRCNSLSCILDVISQPALDN